MYRPNIQHMYCSKLFFCFLFRSVTSFLNKNELAIALETSKELQVHECIFFGNEGDFNILKEFAYNNVPAAFFDYNTFADYSNKLNNTNTRWAVILKGKNLRVVLEKLEGVSATIFFKILIRDKTKNLPRK